MRAAEKAATKIIACEPANASLLDGKEWKPHKLQGWTPDVIPSVPDRSVPHQILPITDEAAIATARDLAKAD